MVIFILPNIFTIDNEQNAFFLAGICKKPPPKRELAIGNDSSRRQPSRGCSKRLQCKEARARAKECTWTYMTEPESRS